jgi:predicted nucleic acid-binding protein
MPTKKALDLVYDTGALISAERGDRRLWALHARALQRKVRPIVPAGCLVESWHGGRAANVSRLLDGCEIEVLEKSAAKRAGVLRQKCQETVGPIDAMVVETALRRKAAVVTSDRGDVESLGRAANRTLNIIDV